MKRLINVLKLMKVNQLKNVFSMILDNYVLYVKKIISFKKEDVLLFNLKFQIVNTMIVLKVVFNAKITLF